MKRSCGLYVRVSSDRQAFRDNGSLDTQASTLKKFIELKNSTTEDTWEVAEIYREEGKSGKNTDRPEYQRMLSDIVRGRINVLLCVKIDRINRSLMDFYRLHEMLEKHDVTFISLHESWDTSTPMGRFGLKLTLAVAELEREQTSERTREKMRWRAEEGLWNGGQILGYDVDPEKKGSLVPNERETEVVRFLFETYLHTRSLRETVRRANARGYRGKRFESRRGKLHPGERFAKTTVSRILNNPAYIGKVRYNGELFTGKQQPILPADLWQKVQAQLPEARKNQRRYGRQRRHTFILKGLMRCGSCGAFMTPSFSHGRNGLHFYYLCTSVNNANGKCRMGRVRAEAIEDVIVQRVKQFIESPDTLRKAVEISGESRGQKLRGFDGRRKCLQHEADALRERLRKILDFIATGNAGPAMRHEIQELETLIAAKAAELDRASEELAQASTQALNDARILEQMKVWVKGWDHASDDERQRLTQLLINQVVWKPGEIEASYFAWPPDFLSEVVHCNGTAGSPVEIRNAELSQVPRSHEKFRVRRRVSRPMPPLRRLGRRRGVRADLRLVSAAAPAFLFGPPILRPARFRLGRRHRDRAGCPGGPAGAVAQPLPP